MKPREAAIGFIKARQTSIPRPAIAITGDSPTTSGRGGSSQTPRSRAYWLLSLPASRKTRRGNRARPPRRSRSASALSYSRSTMLAGRCEIDRNRVADPIIATGDDRGAALQRNCAFPLALRHSSGRTACRPIAYPDPDRRTSISAASWNRLYACAASTIASDCAG